MFAYTVSLVERYHLTERQIWIGFAIAIALELAWFFRANRITPTTKG